MGQETVARPATADGQLAAAIGAALKANLQVPFDRIITEVRDGVVTLSGHVNWKYQSAAAVSAASAVQGVGLINNQIVVDIA